MRTRLKTNEFQVPEYVYLGISKRVAHVACTAGVPTPCESRNHNDSLRANRLGSYPMYWSHLGPYGSRDEAIRYHPFLPLAHLVWSG